MRLGLRSISDVYGSSLVYTRIRGVHNLQNLSEDEYFKDSNGNIVGFLGHGSKQYYQNQEISADQTTVSAEGDGNIVEVLGHESEQYFQNQEISADKTTVSEEGDDNNGSNEDLQDQVGQVNRHRPRPSISFYTGEPRSAQTGALGRIKVFGSGRKYLQFKVNDKLLKISCLSDIPPISHMNGDLADTAGRLIDAKKNKLLYRRRIWNEKPKIEHDEGPYQAKSVWLQSYQILQYKGEPRVNPYRSDGLSGSQVQRAIAAEESDSGTESDSRTEEYSATEEYSRTKSDSGTSNPRSEQSQ